MRLSCVGACVHRAITRSGDRLRSTDANRAEALAAVASTLRTDWEKLEDETLRTLFRKSGLDETATEECGTIVASELGPIILEEVVRLEVRSEHGSSWILDPPLGQLLGDWEGITGENEVVVRALALHMREGCEDVLRADPRRFVLIFEDFRVGFPALADVLVDVLFEPLRDAVRTSPPDLAASMLRQVDRLWNLEAHARLCRALRDDLIRMLQSSPAIAAAGLVRAISRDALEDVVRSSMEHLAEKIKTEPAASVAELVSSLVRTPKVNSELVHRLRADLVHTMAAAAPEGRASLMLAVAHADRNVARKIVRDLRKRLETDLREAPPAAVVRTFIAAGKADPDLTLHPEWLRISAAAFRDCPKDIRDELIMELTDLSFVAVRRFLNTVQPGLAAYLSRGAQRP